MDIRIINKDNEIINVTNLSIMTSANWLIGMNDKGETVRIEQYESKEEAKDNLEKLGMVLEEAHKDNVTDFLIRT